MLYKFLPYWTRDCIDLQELLLSFYEMQFQWSFVDMLLSLNCNVQRSLYELLFLFSQVNGNCNGHSLNCSCCYLNSKCNVHYVKMQALFSKVRCRSVNWCYFVNCNLFFYWSTTCLFLNSNCLFLDSNFLSLNRNFFYLTYQLQLSLCELQLLFSKLLL